MISKKTLAAALLTTIFFLKNSTAQTVWTVNWEAAIPVAPTGFGALSPKIEMLPGGVPGVLWGKAGAAPKIYFSRFENGTFAAPTEVHGVAPFPNLYDFGGLDLAVSGDRVFAVFESSPRGIFLRRSDDAGKTFAPPVNVFDPPTTDWATLSAVAATEDGNPVVAFIQELTSETKARQMVCTSADGGLTFSPPVVASEPANGDFVCECCPPSLLCSGDSIWLAFRNNRNNLRDVWVSRSTDGGTTFDLATDVDATDWLMNVCPISGPKMTRIGSDIAVAWMSKGTGLTRCHASTLEAATMLPGEQIGLPVTGSSAAIQTQPDVAGAGDTLGIVWEETGFGTNGQEVLFMLSVAGLPVSGGQVVNLTTAPGSQKFPTLTFENGVFHLVYADLQTSRLWYRRGVLTEVVSTGEVEKPLQKMRASMDATGQILQVQFFETAENQSFSLKLFDSTGRLVKQWNSVSGSGFHEFFVDDLPAGGYFLNCETLNGRRLEFESNLVLKR